jgi:hypothetical protein
MRFFIIIQVGALLINLSITRADTLPVDAVASLNQALSELSANSSVFEIAEGTYHIASTWTVSRDHITVRGAGIGKTVLIREPGFSGHLICMNGEDSMITALTIDGNGRGQSVKMGPELALHKPREVAQGIEVKNFAHIGIAVFPSECRVSQCRISGLGDDTDTMGIWHDAGPTSTDSTIMIDHNTVTGSGIYCTGGTITITNNQLSGNHCTSSSGGGQMDIGNAFTTNTVATISGNTILNGGNIKACGIEMGGGTFTIANNTIRGHGASGIGLGHNAIKATITGNTVSNSGRYIAEKNKPQCRSAIYILYGAANVEISGNRCFDDQPNKTQTWGIILVPPPTRPDPRFSPRSMEHIVVRDNDLRGNLHAEGLLDESMARDRTISGNLPAQANR